MSHGVVRDSLSAKVIAGKRPEGTEEESHVFNWAKSFPCKRNSMPKVHQRGWCYTRRLGPNEPGAGFYKDTRLEGKYGAAHVGTYRDG